jgi:hypothetical protein
MEKEMQNIKENKKRNSPTNLGRNPSYSPLPLSLSPCSAQSTLSPYSFTLSHLRVGPPRQTFLLPGAFAHAAGFYGDLAESFPPPARTSGLAHIKPVALQPPSSSSRIVESCATSPPWIEKSVRPPWIRYGAPCVLLKFGHQWEAIEGYLATWSISMT